MSYTIVDVIKELFSGRLKFVPAAVMRARYTSCKECPLFLQHTKRCSACGCFMPLKVKLQKSQCPVGHWGAYNE